MIFRRRKTPRLIQMEAVECGAAALGIILGYYGSFISLEELRLTCGVSRDGVSAFQIIEAAKYYGLEGEGYYIKWDELQEVDRPAILFWEHKHFLILEKIRGQHAWINDPATGPRKIHIDELRKSYSGVAILLKPSKTFSKRGKNISLASQLKERFFPVFGKLGYLFLLEMLVLIFALTSPALMRIFVDTFLQQILPSWTTEFIWFLSLIIIVSTAIAWLRGRFLNQLLVGLSIRFTTKFVGHILSLPISFFSQRFPGELLNRIQLNTRLATIFTEGIVVSVINLIMIVIYGVILFYYNELIALVGIGAVLFNFLLLYWINQTRVHAYAHLQQEEFKTIGISFDTIENIETMKSVAHDTFFFSRIAGHYTNSLNALQTIGRKDTYLGTLSSFSIQLTNILLLAVGAWIVMQGKLTIGMLVAFQILMNFFLSPFNRLIQFGADVQSLKVDMARVDDVLQHPIDPLLESRKHEEPPRKLSGKLTFRSVTFGYAPLEKPFIERFDLTVEKGEMIGIVGPVGSGKTTVAKLGSALYQPWEGEVLYDDKPAFQQARSSLKQSIASVDQEIQLFAASIYENIALWDSQVTEEMVFTAAKRAQLYEEILRFPSGFHTQLLEGGVNLSQGQKQRLELARAFLYDPTLLILDESLNSVDSETEAQILQHFRQSRCTTLLISHRLSTVRQCDRIIVMEEGKIVGEGDHPYLLNTCESYKRLLTLEH